MFLKLIVKSETTDKVVLLLITDTIMVVAGIAVYNNEVP
jgi:hypothetical protein